MGAKDDRRLQPVAPQRLPGDFWDHEPLRAALIQRHLGQVIRAYRHHPRHGRRPLSQEVVAQWIGVTQAQLSRIETGPPVVHLDRLVQVARLLGIPQSMAWFSLPESRDLAHAATPDVEPTSRSAEVVVLDTPMDIIQRMRSIGTCALDEFTIQELEAVVCDAIADYERIGPAAVAPTLVAQRRWLHGTMLERHPPRVAVRLFRLAVQMSGVLASVALDLQSFRIARSYAAEAFQLTDMVGEPDLAAWVRGTQCLIEYYAGRYEESLELARDGLRIAPSGPQSIRLVVNGEARALARLGQARAVDVAVHQALDLFADLATPPSPTPNLTLGPYCSARIHGNAATAYLVLGQAHKVLEHGGAALQDFDLAGLQGPRALTRLDMATALATGTDRPDPVRAALLAQEALSIDGAAGYAAVVRRAREFLTAVDAFRDVAEVSAVRQQLAALRTPTVADTDQEGSRS